LPGKAYSPHLWQQPLYTGGRHVTVSQQLEHPHGLDSRRSKRIPPAATVNAALPAVKNNTPSASPKL